jgi:L-lactate dehydrogenase (cytochrome)
VNPLTLPSEEKTVLTEADLERQAARSEMPPVESMLLLQDFENWAERVLSSTAWAYYRSATDEERSE